jgi:hypothetical protein
MSQKFPCELRGGLSSPSGQGSPTIASCSAVHGDAGFRDDSLVIRRWNLKSKLSDSLGSFILACILYTETPNRGIVKL